MIHLLPEIVLAEGTRNCSTTEAMPVVGDASLQELEKYEGSWMLVSWLFDGEEQSVTERYVMTFVAEGFTIRRGGTLIERGHVEGLDPERRPKPFEYVPTEVRGEPVRSKCPGIHLLGDDGLIWCIGYKGARPTELSSPAGSMNELVEHKRFEV
jgi:uncharacterized protein (TIGR03067 family)